MLHVEAPIEGEKQPEKESTKIEVEAEDDEDDEDDEEAGATEAGPGKYNGPQLDK